MKIFKFGSREKMEFYRFWTYLQLHGIIITTLTLELMCLESYEITYKSFFVSDITKLFSSIIIALILVLKDVKSDNKLGLNFENFRYEKK